MSDYLNEVYLGNTLLAWLSAAGMVIAAIFRKFVHSYIESRGDSTGKQQQAGGLIIIVNIAIWVLGVIFLIDNLGYNVTTLVAGLGIGGIAIALAAQAMLGDLFSYFVIFS